MITKEDVLQLHTLSIEHYGGSHGVRDTGMMESAVNRPYQEFETQPLYPTAIDQAAAIFESMIANHPFIDGNKRTGLLAMFALLDMNGIRLSASEENMYQFTIDVATGKMDVDEIASWLSENTY
ncbi:type II toxin-antitoxin system death-on-curing family toxin [Taibaiella soli]|uniref:Type II toxin-antitoxin system death-on-curing family toxin n=1 Tax=Taibaiella soli TaxID=1649169 RepID=A0A2W2B5Y1_9BACT|nr:type II toxin-antitoxin system death-on-curing family toxin [Taibaiella soli]PZF71387.1 type II toxin-antitoxin system death-on-curing family toxin [Taibaiella soli]